MVEDVHYGSDQYSYFVIGDAGDDEYKSVQALNPSIPSLSPWLDHFEYNSGSLSLNAILNFGELGTYTVERGIKATKDSTEYTSTGAYTFHVGPIAELEVRDGGASAEAATGETAFTIVAVNNGPDDALGAKVDVTLPQGATVVRAIPSAGTYNDGVWNIGGLQRQSYRSATGLPEGETLTIIAADVTEGAEATATISNDNVNHPYRVVIDGTTHTGTVYDHIDANNTATLTPRAGTGEPLPDTPVTGPPQSVSAVVLEWPPVESVNGWAVSHYEVQRSSSEWEELADNAQCSADADASTCQYVDTSAKTGQMYRYRVRAVNTPGVAGPWSSVMQIGVAAAVGAPEAPVLAAHPNEPDGITEILLTWTKPVENGSSITSYTIEAADRSSGPWAAITDLLPTPTLGPEATSWTHKGLDPGKRYYYRITATNALGNSPPSQVVEVSTRAVGIPAAPINVAAAPEGGDAIDVKWDKPQRDGGNPITRYEVQWSADGVSGWRSAGSTADGDTLTFKHSGLRPGETRHYRVAARNSRGLSDWSYPPYAVATTLVGVPGVPRSLTARAEAHDTINLTWTAPASNGDPITSYEIQWSDDGAPGSWQALETVRENIGGVVRNSHVDSGLDPVTTRYYRVRAVNGTGAGSWSRAASATTPTKPGAGPPTAPLNLTLVAGDGSIEAVWDPPGSDGGSAIKDYLVQFRASGSWETVPHGGTHTYTLIFGHSDGRPLTNGRSHSVRVAAINENGVQGSWAQGSAVPNIPRRLPSEPPNVVPTGGDGEITVTWREPYDVGHPALSGYRVQYRAGKQEESSGVCAGYTDWLPSTPISVGSSARSHTITGLANGTTYQVQVWAVNSEGDSPRAGCDGALAATPEPAEDPEPPPEDPEGGAPSAPRNLALTPGDREIRASWQAPEDLGDPEITDYLVQYRRTGETSWDSRKATASPAAIAGLTNGTEYEVRVLVSNEHGDAVTAIERATPVEPGHPPTAPRNLSLMAGDGEIQVSWDAPQNLGKPEIAGYTVWYREDGQDAWTEHGTMATSAASATITGLTNGTRYEVEVEVSNQHGTAVSETKGATPKLSPNQNTAPQNLISTQENYEDVDGSPLKVVVVSWAPPDSEKFPGVTGYVVQFRRGTSGDWLDRRCTISDDPPPIEETCSDHRGGPTTVAGIMGVTNGTYQVRVAAVNREETGAWAVVTHRVR